MKHKRFFITIIVLIGCLALNPLHVNSQDNLNTVTFDNQSGEPALVKLIGPTGHMVEVAIGTRKTVNVAPGRYHTLIRYGRTPEAYRYAKGDPFNLTKTAKKYSSLTITLHKVIGGDYPTRQISAKDFNNITVAAQKEKQSTKLAQETQDAIRSGDVNTLKSLLEKDSKWANAQDKIGRTILHHAAVKGDKNLVKLAIARGANVNAKEKSGQTALMLAAMRGYAEIAKTLLVNGASVNAKEDAGGKIFLAELEGTECKVKVFKTKGKFVSGMTALMFASGFGHKSTVETLIAHHANVNAKDEDGRTALMFASKNGKDNVVETLLAKGANINVKSQGSFLMEGPPPRLPFLPGRRTQPKRQFVGYIGSPDVGKKRTDGWTALSLAENLDQRSTILLLKKAGAKE